MPAAVRDLLDAVAAVLLRMGGIVAAVGPSRLWPVWDEHLPVTTSALPSSLLTLVAAVAIGIPGFLRYGAALTDVNTGIFLEAAARPEAEGVLDSSALTGMNGLALFGFLFLSPLGWTTMYLGGSGLVRVVSAVVTEGIGDPILTGIDAMLLRAVRAGRAGAARHTRRSLEGPAVPDRAVRGASLGLADAEIVIVSSRRKMDWDKGTVVFAGEKCYRVGTIVERTIGGQLRTLYPLTEHRDLEVVRRAVRYDMPVLPGLPFETKP
jgi:hypothetical protein